MLRLYFGRGRPVSQLWQQEEDLDESFLGLRVWTMEPTERAHLWTLRQGGALDEHLAYPRGAIRAEESIDRLAARLAPVVPAAPDAADGGQPVPEVAPPVQAAQPLVLV